jgi:hypothetical protein
MSRHGVCVCGHGDRTTDLDGDKVVVGVVLMISEVVFETRHRWRRPRSRNSDLVGVSGPSEEAGSWVEKA